MKIWENFIKHLVLRSLGKGGRELLHGLRKPTSSQATARSDFIRRRSASYGGTSKQGETAIWVKSGCRHVKMSRLHFITPWQGRKPSVLSEVKPSVFALTGYAVTSAASLFFLPLEKRQKKWWQGPGSNWWHEDFQSSALPTELPRHSLLTEKHQTVFPGWWH